MTLTTDRLAVLKSKPSMSGLDDAFLTAELDGASAEFLAYTHRLTDTADYDQPILLLAAIRVEMDGAEATTSAGEGGQSRSWVRWPPELKQMMNSWRLIRAVSAEGL